jgi:hypothetical protein
MNEQDQLAVKVLAQKVSSGVLAADVAMAGAYALGTTREVLSRVSTKSPLEDKVKMLEGMLNIANVYWDKEHPAHDAERPWA